MNNQKKIVIGLSGLLVVGALIAWKTEAGWSLPVSGRISEHFGNITNPLTGQPEFHNGIDIAVPIGTPVVAPMDGAVEKVYTNLAGGNQVVIVHENGYRTGYAHLDTVSVVVGDFVTRGQQIGLSGNTGNVTGPHLHFVVLNPSGVAVDPEGLVYPPSVS